MRLQILSDLHLETEDFDPAPAPGAADLTAWTIVVALILGAGVAAGAVRYGLDR